MDDTQKEVTLGGRVFVSTGPDDMTFDQYAWIQQASYKAGLGEELVNRLKPIIDKAFETETALTDEEAAQVTEAIVSRCYQERAYLEVLTGLLVEKGKEWDHDDAMENREFLGKMKGMADIETTNIILAQGIMGFFWSGLASMTTSPNSSKALATVVAKMQEEEDGPGQAGGSETSES